MQPLTLECTGPDGAACSTYPRSLCVPARNIKSVYDKYKYPSTVKPL
mgnify:CR=1 FL=1